MFEDEHFSRGEMREERLGAGVGDCTQGVLSFVFTILDKRERERER